MRARTSGKAAGDVVAIAGLSAKLVAQEDPAASALALLAARVRVLLVVGQAAVSVPAPAVSALRHFLNFLKFRTRFSLCVQ